MFGTILMVVGGVAVLYFAIKALFGTKTPDANGGGSGGGGGGNGGGGGGQVTAKQK